MKRKCKLLLFILVLLMSMTTLTACAGTIEIDTSKEKEEYTGGAGPGFMSVYKDAIVINGKKGAIQKGTITKDKSIDGLNVGSNIPRQIAKMMANTVLGSSPGSDQFDGAGADSWGNFSFSPGTILTKTNEATMAALSGGNGAMSAVYSALRKVAMGVLFVVWFMGFVSSAASEQITVETSLKSLLQLVCGMLIVLNAHIFAQAFASLGNVAIGNSVGAIGAGYSSLVSKVAELLNEINYLGIGINLGVITKGWQCLWWDSGCLWVIALLAYPFYQSMRAAY